MTATSELKTADELAWTDNRYSSIEDYSSKEFGSKWHGAKSKLNKLNHKLYANIIPSV